MPGELSSYRSFTAPIEDDLIRRGIPLADWSGMGEGVLPCQTRFLRDRRYDAPSAPLGPHRVRRGRGGVDGGCVQSPGVQSRQELAKGCPTTTSTTTTTTLPPTTTTAPFRTTTTQRATPATTTTTTLTSTTTTTAPVQPLTYACSGSAPGGLTIVYGPAVVGPGDAMGDTVSDAILPWSVTPPSSSPAAAPSNSYGLTATLSAPGRSHAGSRSGSGQPTGLAVVRALLTRRRPARQRSPKFVSTRESFLGCGTAAHDGPGPLALRGECHRTGVLGCTLDDNASCEPSMISA
jgi:hypothetical protein